MSSAVRPLAVARGGLCRRNGQPEEVTTDGRCAGNATKLHGIEAVRKGGSCAMTWRKKLSDELSVRTYAADAWLWRCLDLRACAARLMAQQTRDLGDRCPGCGE